MPKVYPHSLPTIFFSTPDYSKILVVGGYSDSSGAYLDTAEAIDLDSDTRNCAPVANYPVPIAWGAGAMVDGRPRVCGGQVGMVGVGAGAGAGWVPNRLSLNAPGVLSTAS